MILKDIVISVYPDGRMDDENTAKYVDTTQNTLAKMRSEGTGPKFFKAGGKGKPWYYQTDVDDWLRKSGELQKSSDAGATA